MSGDGAAERRSQALTSIPSAVAAYERAASALRSSALDLAKTIEAASSIANHEAAAEAPKGAIAVPQHVMSMLAASDTARKLGAVAHLLETEAGRADEIVGSIIGWAGSGQRIKGMTNQRLSELMRFLHEGVIDAAIACPCEACPMCEARNAATDPEASRAAISRVLRGNDADSGLVDVGGAPMRAPRGLIQ